MSLVLVTGATGFLGQHLLSQLRASRAGEAAARLRVLCRGRSPWDDDPAVEVVRGDITSFPDVLRAMDSAAEVYHLAGVVSRNPSDAPLLHRVHVEGTRNVCEAALRCRPDKIVVASSSGTIAVSREPVIHNEDSGYQDAMAAGWPYYASKIEAEKLALSYCERERLPIVVVNPSLLLGPGDERGSSTGDVELFLDGQITARPGGGLNFVDARDAAAGAVAAMRLGRPGQRYLLGGANWTFGEFLEALAKIAGRSAPKLRLPLAVSLAGARALRALAPLAGRRFRLDDASIRMAECFWYCDSAKARGELGFAARDPLETLHATIEDIFRRRGAARALASSARAGATI